MTTTNSPPPAMAQRLDDLLRKAVEGRKHVRHGLLGVARVDGSWVWQGAHGLLDTAGAPAKTTSRYLVASVTKLYTAAVTMRLVEQGNLGLGDKLVDLLSAEVTNGLHVLDDVDHTDEITVEHLLGHTSGLPDYYEEAPKGGRSAQERLLAGEDAPMPFDEVVRVVRQELEPHFPPQPLAASKAKYADTNYQLLGAIIEQVRGQALGDVFDEMLFAPLGLDDTSSYPHTPRSGASPEPAANVWSKNIVLRTEGALRFQKPDGGIISTLGDQLEFMRALASGQVFDEATTWPRMQQRFNRVFFPIDYGLGVMRYAPPRWMSPMFAIPPIIGHSGSTATWLFHCPDLDIALAGTFDVAQPPLPFRFLPHVLRAVSQET